MGKVLHFLIQEYYQRMLKAPLFLVLCLSMRNNYCRTNGCLTSGINTVFVDNILTFPNSAYVDSWGQNECSGTASTYTWQCTNIPKAPNAAGRWDISRSRCVQKVCTPGPFLANGHFDYPRLVC